MSLFDQAKAVEVAGANAGPSQVISKSTIDVARVAELADKVEAAFPGMELNTNAIAKGGKTATGQPVVVFACKRRLPTTAAVTVYYNGTVVWAGVEPLSL